MTQPRTVTFQYQHIESIELYCMVCRTWSMQYVGYRSASSYTAETLTCVSCSGIYNATTEQITFIRYKNEQFDRWGSPSLSLLQCRY